MSLSRSLNTNFNPNNQLYDFQTDNNKEFNIKLFNENYEKYKSKRENLVSELENTKLAELNNEQNNKQLHELTLPEILTGVKDSTFAVLDDVLQMKVTKETFLIENRMFFIGLLIIVLILLSYIFNSLFPSNKKNYYDYNNKYFDNYYGMYPRVGCKCMK